MAKLIVRCEGRRVLPNLQSDSGRNGLLARWIVLLFSEAEENQKSIKLPRLIAFSLAIRNEKSRRNNLTNNDADHRRG